MANQEEKDDENAKGAHFFFVRGKYNEAFEIYAEILRRNPNHYPSLLGYAEEISRRGNYKEALNVTLRVLVHFGMLPDKKEESERAGFLFAKLLKQPGSIKMLLQMMQNSNSKGGAEALDFLGKIAMQHGELLGSIELFRAAIKSYPEGAKFSNNLMDALEILNQNTKAFDVAKWYLQSYPTQSVGGVEAAMVLKTWNEGGALQSHAESKNETETSSESENTQENQETNTATTYTDEQLELLSLYYKIVKLLFISGKTDLVKALIPVIQPAKKQGGDLHLTHIRNDNSYFGYLEALIAAGGVLDERMRDSKTTLPIIGDSHILTPAWRTLNLEKKGEVLLKPLLVTGCKIWHLRKDSHFYPKVHFYQLLKEIPKNGEAIFMFGEIDCREGILMGMASGEYPSLEEGIKAIIDLYIEILNFVIVQKKLTRLYVHPVPPVLDEIRWIIIAFNRALAARLVAIKQKDPKTPLRWLHIESEILNLGKESMKDEYKLDGSHLHPSYITLIEDSINTVDKYGV